MVQIKYLHKNNSIQIFIYLFNVKIIIVNTRKKKFPQIYISSKKTLIP